MNGLVVMFVVMAITLIIGIPVAFSLAMSAVAYLIATSFTSLSVIAQTTIDGINSFPYLALPLFILAGELMSYGCTPRLLNLVRMLIGRMPGSLGATTVGTATFFGAVSGSGIATVASVGGMIGPEMTKENYKKGYTASLLAATATIGVLIPPSIPFVTYSIVTGVSVGKMFIAGIIPGLILGSTLLVWNYIVCKKNNYGVINMHHYTFKEAIHIIVDALLPLAMPVFVMGGILSGAVTPTESAAVASLYSFILAKFVYKELKWKDCLDVAVKCTTTTAITMFILACSVPFAWVLTITNFAPAAASVVMGISESPFIIITVVTILLIVLGTFMDTAATIVLTTPILLPIVMAAGWDPIHYGVVLVINSGMGALTPPTAVCLVTACNIMGINMSDSMPDVWYMCGIMIIAMIIVMIFPETTMFLPSLAR